MPGYFAENEEDIIVEAVKAAEKQPSEKICGPDELSDGVNYA